MKICEAGRWDRRFRLSWPRTSAKGSPGYYYVPPENQIHTSDGPVPVPFETVAPDKRNLIPQPGAVVAAGGGLGTLHADDYGDPSRFKGYRLDLYAGPGQASCVNSPSHPTVESNPTVVVACTQGFALCAASPGN